MTKLLLLFIGLLLSPTLFAQKTWTGTTSTDWTVASNWEPAGMPSATDDIVIPSGLLNYPVVPTGANVSFRSMMVDFGGALSVEAGAYLSSNSSAEVAIFLQGRFTNYGTVSLTSNALHGAFNEGLFTAYYGRVFNMQGGKMYLSSLNRSLYVIDAFINYGLVDCIGDIHSSFGLTNSACGSIIVKGSAEISGTLYFHAKNEGMLCISDELKLLGDSFFYSYGILKYNTINNPGLLDQLRSEIGINQPNSSIIITDVPQLAIKRYKNHLRGTAYGVYHDQAGTQPAGTMAGDIFQPDPFLPVGTHTLYLEIDGFEECRYFVPFTYVMTVFPGVWRGTSSADWDLPANWSDGAIPGPTTNVYIPSGTPYAPVISSSSAMANDITIAAGATLTLAANALLDIKGNIIGNGTLLADASEANVTFSGLSSQIIHGGNYANISISGGIGKTLDGNVTVNELFAFSGSTNVILGAHTMTVGYSAKISGYDATNYFVTNGTGGLKKEGITSPNFTFPIGSEIKYAPIAIYNYGTDDNFTARVTDGVYKSYINEVGQGNRITDKVVDKTWFISEQVPGGSNVILTLSWDRYDELNTFARVESLVSHYKNEIWEQTSPTYSFELADLYSVVLAGVTSFSPFSVTNSDAALPVTLSRFDAVREGSTALLSWSTTEETNSDRFEVERSINGKNWQNIGSVKSNGESKVLADYHFVDQHPVPSQENLYRLKMVDCDDTFAYSRIRSLKFDALENPVIYPNPVSDKLFVQDFARVSSLRILDVNGKVIYQTNRIGSAGIQVSKLSAGLHLVEISWLDGRKTVQKVVINQ